MLVQKVSHKFPVLYITSDVIAPIIFSGKMLANDMSSQPERKEQELQKQILCELIWRE